MDNEKKKETCRINQKIALDLKNARLMSGKTQNQIAQALGVTYQQIQKYENGTSRIPAARLYQISILLGQSLWPDEAPAQPDIDEDTMKICARIMSIKNPACKQKIRDALYCLTR